MGTSGDLGSGPGLDLCHWLYHCCGTVTCDRIVEKEGGLVTVGYGPSWKERRQQVTTLSTVSREMSCGASFSFLSLNHSAREWWPPTLVFLPQPMLTGTPRSVFPRWLYLHRPSALCLHWTGDARLHVPVNLSDTLHPVCV